MEGGRETTASRLLLFQAPVVCFCYGKVCSTGDHSIKIVVISSACRLFFAMEKFVQQVTPKCVLLFPFFVFCFVFVCLFVFVVVVVLIVETA